MSDIDDFISSKEVFFKELTISRKELNKCIKGDFSGRGIKLFLDKNNLRDKRLIFQEQKHTDNVKIIDKKFLRDIHVVLNNDALATSQKDVYLCAYTADCVPVSFFDSKSSVIGIAHSGWRGTLNSIAQKTAKVMNASLGVDYSNLKCYLGPSIMDCCYEVSMAKDGRVKDFINKFGNGIIKKDNDKIYLNLHEAIKIQLNEVGVLEQNIKISPYCTCCNNKPKLPSYYRDGREYKKSILTIIGINK